MKKMEVWEKTFKKIGYDELKPDENIVKLVPFLKKNKCKNILDLGCGAGRHMVYLGKKGFHMTGLDISNSALNLTEKWLKKEKVKNYFLIKHDMTKIPFPNESFDGVISVNTIHHNPLNKIEKTVNEIERVLKKNGLVFITVNSTKDRKFRTGRKIEYNTYATPGSEHLPKLKGKVIHHFFDREGIERLFSVFKIIKIKEDIRDLNIKRKIKKNAHWLVLCQKIK